MRVEVASALHSYTRAPCVEAEGATLRALLADLDRQHPGLRFRIVDEQDRVRPHMRIFLDEEVCCDLGAPLTGVRSVHILCALSGGG
jgi:hypothetical protein